MSHGRVPGKFGVMAIAVMVGAATLVATPAAKAEGPNTGNISLSAGFDIVSQYWFRGIAQENQGFIFQPWIEVGAGLYEGDENSPIDSIGVAFGVWNSWHSGPSGIQANTSATAPDLMYETDWYVGVSVATMDVLEIGATYTAYTSPNNAFGTTEELAISVGYDDSGLWEEMGVEAPGFEGLQPSFTIAFELDGGADLGNQMGTYYEFAFGPSFTIVDSEKTPITMSMPFTFGFGSDYYEDGTGDDDAFGYFDFGIDFSTPLSFIPESYGSWEAYFGVHVITLGGSAETIAGGVTGGDSTEVYTKFGISMEY